MSNQFIGLTMLVTLSSPPGAQLRGVVSSVEPGKSLTLREVTCPANGKYVQEFTVNAHEVVQLVEAPSENTTPVTTSVPVTVAVPPIKTKFEDPAILSMGKRPTPINNGSATLSTQWSSAAAMERKDSTRTVISREEKVLQDITPTTSTLEPVSHLEVADMSADVVSDMAPEELEAEVAPPQPAPKAGRKGRSRKSRKKIVDDSLETDVIPAKETRRSKGWRQTPLLEPNPSFQPFATLKKGGRRHGRGDESGWGTEDATDVQELGDFDFASSLAKFDKQTVFGQIQAEDETADDDRLVSHNRLPRAKPGTNGGRNLHYTENVLDGLANGQNKNNSTWKSEDGDSALDEITSQLDLGSGRPSRRAESKRPSNRMSVSRKGSAGNSQAGRSLSVGTKQRRHQQAANSDQISARSSKPAFYIVSSERRCEPISALQMLNLENIADNELGLTEDMMTENAGRGIAEVALSASRTGGRSLSQSKNSTIPIVLSFAGNNKSGIRAVAAARHLRNHGLEVVVCVLGLERESELLESLRRQIKVFKSFGGRLVTKLELFEYVKTISAPVDLIIDGLLGLTMSFEELRTGDQASAFELIEFANRSKAPVLAIDIPTGIDPSSGRVNIIDGRQLYIHAQYVVAMGAPKKGLLESMILGEGVVDEDGLESKAKEWQLFVADIGLGSAVWKKAGTRVRRGVDFEGSWVLDMRFQGSSD